ncbi:NADPH:quinone reductase-like Zn-dependent oxidoreductase [Phycicoccus badiiscoriae]|uniref:NADPH:quinone reductase-like Zn-dependent oxidoreductase n=1 Tax=Pedococcus badiiscoriae TaxID=642776 RepID=A0A852WMS0_9MICO|nr:NAD(P)-dependent alcohol dehydrogenase [Pedococcus badiiscoriae]NYG06582.1 NADPH:quinone reductase-like Zn-dependent oxidoreductase [Pedococcus badiiscoriae]
MTDIDHAPAQAPSALPATMRAAVYERYGPPQEVVTVRTVPVPEVGADDVLVRVGAASVNALDWHLVTGLPMFARPALGLRRPKRQVPGADVAGVVEAVGSAVTRFQPGDRVFGEVSGGAFAEFLVAPAEWLVPVPDRIPIEQAATIGVAAETALQGLRDWGRLQAGQRVLVNGASGGVGSFAVQLAKALGAAHVTAVCSTGNVEAARRGGADRVVDYTREDVRSLGETFDLFFDNAGSLTLRDSRRLVSPGGSYVMVTSPKSRWMRPLPRMLSLPVYFAVGSQRAPAFKVASRNRADLELLIDLVATGAVSPVVDRRWALADAPEALRVQGEFHSRGKSVVVP